MFDVGIELLLDNIRYIIISVNEDYYYAITLDFTNIIGMPHSFVHDRALLTGRSVDLKAIILYELGNYNEDVNIGSDKHE